MPVTEQKAVLSFFAAGRFETEDGYEIAMNLGNSQDALTSAADFGSTLTGLVAPVAGFTDNATPTAPSARAAIQTPVRRDKVDAASQPPSLNQPDSAPIDPFSQPAVTALVVQPADFSRQIVKSVSRANVTEAHGAETAGANHDLRERRPYSAPELSTTDPAQLPTPNVGMQSVTALGSPSVLDPAIETPAAKSTNPAPTNGGMQVVVTQSSPIKVGSPTGFASTPRAASDATWPTHNYDASRAPEASSHAFAPSLLRHAAVETPCGPQLPRETVAYRLPTKIGGKVPYQATLNKMGSAATSRVSNNSLPAAIEASPRTLPGSAVLTTRKDTVSSQAESAPSGTLTTQSDISAMPIRDYMNLEKIDQDHHCGNVQNPAVGGVTVQNAGAVITSDAGPITEPANSAVPTANAPTQGGTADGAAGPRVSTPTPVIEPDRHTPLLDPIVSAVLAFWRSSQHLVAPASAPTLPPGKANVALDIKIQAPRESRSGTLAPRATTKPIAIEASSKTTPSAQPGEKSIVAVASAASSSSAPRARTVSTRLPASAVSMPLASGAVTLVSGLTRCNQGQPANQAAKAGPPASPALAAASVSMSTRPPAAAKAGSTPASPVYGQPPFNSISSSPTGLAIASTSALDPTRSTSGEIVAAVSLSGQQTSRARSSSSNTTIDSMTQSDTRSALSGSAVQDSPIVDVSGAVLNTDSLTSAEPSRPSLSNSNLTTGLATDTDNGFAQDSSPIPNSFISGLSGALPNAEPLGIQEPSRPSPSNSNIATGSAKHAETHSAQAGSSFSIQRTPIAELSGAGPRADTPQQREPKIVDAGDAATAPTDAAGSTASGAGFANLEPAPPLSTGAAPTSAPSNPSKPASVSDDSSLAINLGDGSVPADPNLVEQQGPARPAQLQQASASAASAPQPYQAEIQAANAHPQMTAATPIRAASPVATLPPARSQSADLKLTLDGAGTAHVSIRERAGDVDVRIVAPTAQSAQRIEHEVSALGRVFAPQGLRLRSAEVTARDANSGGGGGNTFDRSGQQKDRAPGEIFILDEVNQ